MTTYPKDDLGNVQVDFVWGNFPLQPDELRASGHKLDMSLDNHVIADIGWSNYPSFIAGYEGDEDDELEYVVPDLLRKTRAEAEALLDNHNTDLNLFDVSHTLTVFGLESTGKTVRVFAFDENAWGDSALMNLKNGDLVVVDNNEYDFGGEVKVTKVNNDGENSWFEFKTSTELNLDTSADGTVYAGSNLVDVITVQRFWNAAGSIKNPGTNVHVRYFEAAPVAPPALIGPTTDWTYSMNGHFTFNSVTVLPQEINGSAAYNNYKLVLVGGAWAGEYVLSNGAVDGNVYVQIIGGFPAGSQGVQGSADGGIATIVAV